MRLVATVEDDDDPFPSSCSHTIGYGVARLVPPVSSSPQIQFSSKLHNFLELLFVIHFDEPQLFSIW